MLVTRKALPLLILLVAASSFGCFESKTVVTRVKPHVAGQPRSKMNGVMFALPRTVVKVDVPVLRERLSPGQFYALSPFFFPGERFIKAAPLPTPIPAPSDDAGVVFSLDEPKFGVRGKPDPEETFMVSIRGGRFETKTLLLDVTEDGIIAKAEAESKDETIDFVTQGLQSVATIAAPLLPFGADDVDLLADINRAILRNPKLAERVSDKNQRLNKEEAKKLLEDAFFEQLTPREKLIYLSLPDEYKEFLRNEIRFDYLLQLSETEREFFWGLSKAQRDYFRALTPEQKAELPRAKVAYNKVQGFINRREELVRSEPQPGSPPETLATKLKEIDGYIKSFKQSFFIGAKSQVSWTGNFEFDPTPAQLEVRLFNYSETEGICETITNGIGNRTIKPPPHFMFKRNAANPTCDSSRGVILRIDVPAAQLANNLVRANFDDSGERGFYYRVPAKVTALLLEESQVQQHDDPTSAGGQGPRFTRDEVAREGLSVAQLGHTASLPASTGGRRSSYKVVYYDATGAVRTFNIGSDALIQKSNAEDVEATLTELRDAEVKKLKRDTERLKAEKDKIDAQDALKKAKEGNANRNTNANSNGN